MDSVAYPPQSKRLLDQVREVLRYKHYSLKTEQAYLYWIRFFVRWHGRNGQMQHPRDMGGFEVTQFLTMLANERHVSVSTHNQALSALLFLYREVLTIDLPWLTDVQRPTRPRRIPSVLTKAEVAALLGALDGEQALLAKLLYGTGMRLMEGLRLRVKDADFDRQVLIVREAKGGKDRVVMLPRSLHEPLKAQVGRARAIIPSTSTKNAVSRAWGAGPCTKLGHHELIAGSQQTGRSICASIPARVPESCA